jgi:hypothetical protein
MSVELPNHLENEDGTSGDSNGIQRAELYLRRVE